MKYVIALLVGANILILAVGLLLNKHIGSTAFSFLVLAALAAGFGIAKHDILKRLALGIDGMAVETAIDQINLVKEKAVLELETQIAAQKGEIKLLIDNMNDAREKLKEQEISISSLIEDANETKVALEKVAAAAAPPQLVLRSKDVDATESGYRAVLIFGPAENKPFGSLRFVAKISSNSETKITAFTVSQNVSTPPFVITADGKKISRGQYIYYPEAQLAADGKTAILNFVPMGVGLIVLELKFTGPADVEVLGNYLHEPVSFSVE